MVFTSNNFQSAGKSKDQGPRTSVLPFTNALIYDVNTLLSQSAIVNEFLEKVGTFVKKTRRKAREKLFNWAKEQEK